MVVEEERGVVGVQVSGDVMPQTGWGKLVTLVTMFLGLAIVGMCISIIQESLEDKYMDAMNLMEEAYEIGSGIVEDLASYWESESTDPHAPEDDQAETHLHLPDNASTRQ